MSLLSVGNIEEVLSQITGSSNLVKSEIENNLANDTDLFLLAFSCLSLS